MAHDNDCVIGHYFLYPFKLAAARQRKPHFTVTFCHASIPSATQVPFPFPDLGVFLNRLSWKVLNLVFNQEALRKPFMRLWLAEGKAPVENVLTDLLTSQQLNLVAVDALFCPFNEEWPPNNRVCGFLNLTEDAQHWAIPQSVQNFLEEGKPPGVYDFRQFAAGGSRMGHGFIYRSGAFGKLRAIIQTSSVRYPAESRQDNLYFIGKHLHQPLFRHCAAVMHHGGAGTTHAAILSGCPSIVVPFMDEQLFW